MMSKKGEDYNILIQRISERELYIEELEVSIENYKKQNEQYENALEEEKSKIDTLRRRIEEMEQWTSHLQWLCDERKERMECMEQCLCQPFLSIVHLARFFWRKRKRRKKNLSV